MPEQPIQSEVPAAEPQRQPAEEVNVVELTMAAEEALRAATLDEDVRQLILNTLHFLELPIKDPSTYQEMGVNAALSLREKYPVLMRSREMALDAVKSLVESGRQGGVLPDDARITGMALALFIAKQKEYDEVILADTGSASPEAIADAVMAKSAGLRAMLGLAQEHAAHWDVLLANLKEPIPAPSVAVDGEGNAPFLHLQHQDLLSSRKAVLDMLRDHVALLDINPGDKVSDKEKAIILEGLFQYGKKKEAYLVDTKARGPSSAMSAALYSGLGEVAEELAEDHLDQYLGKIKGIELAGASARVRAALARAGMAETPAVLNTLLSGGGAGAQVLRETLRAVTPQSYASLLFYALYLHSAEDKTRAFLSYSMFMGAGQALDLAPSALASIASRVPALAKFAPRLAKVKLPMVAKVGILMLAAWGFSDEIEWALDAVERNADPLAYDISGNVIGVISAPLDVLPMYGITLGTEDPMRDQMKYLTYEAGISRNWIGTTFNHRIEWWDNLVDGYAREETNPVRKRMLENERIAGGPGGTEGWVSRRAFAYFKDLEQIRGMEESINADLQSLGIGDGMVNLSSRLTDIERDTGDRNVREAIVYLEPYDSMYADIDAAIAKAQEQSNSEDSIEELTKKREQLQSQRSRSASNGGGSSDVEGATVSDPHIDERIAALDRQLADRAQSSQKIEQLRALRTMYQTYEALARKADQDRSDYVKLGIMSADWFRRAPAGADGIMPGTPDIVRRGMLSEMVYQGRRREALQIPQDESVTVREHTGQLRENYEADGPPSIMLDPAGWITYFAVSGRTWDERIDTATSHDALNIFTERLSQHVPREKYNRTFEPFVKAILEQKVAKYDPHAVIGPLASEFAETMFDGTLQSGEQMIQRENERNPSNHVHLPNLLVFGEERGLNGYPLTFRDSTLPMIACSRQLSSDCNVRSVMQFEYDERQDRWTVETTSVGTIEFRTGGVLTPKGTRTENGTHRTTESFSAWRLRHPLFAAQVIQSLNAYRERVQTENARRETERQEGKTRESQEQIATRERAKQTPGVWIDYPHYHTEYTERRHERVAYIAVEGRDKGYFAYLRSPEVTTGPSFRSADPQVVQAVGSYRTTRVEIVDERTGANYAFSGMHGDYAEFFAKQHSSIPVDIVTRSVALPVPENPTLSVRNVLALFVQDIDHRDNRDMEATLVGEYQQLRTVAEQTRFLQRFERLCRNQTENGKKHLTKDMFASMMSAYRSQLIGGYEDAQWKTFAEGDAILAVIPDTKGIYTVEKSGREGVTPIYFMFDGVQWKWHPGVVESNPYPDRWYGIDTVNVHWKRANGEIGYASPVGENVTVLHRLQGLGS